MIFTKMATGVPSRQEKISNCVKALTGKPDFPSFSQHVQAIMAAVDEEGVSARDLTRLILRDYSLSLILLRRADAYNFSGRPILSITHAVVMLGTEAVRNLAAGLLIFEHFHNKPPAVRELMTLSLLTASHVQQIARHVPEVPPEEAYLCGMVRNLGELLISYYLPLEYARILKLASDRKRPLAAACTEVLQFSFEDLGEAVAGYWHMPKRLAECQRATAPGRIRGPSKPDLLMAAVSLGHELTAALYRAEPGAAAARLKSCMEDHYAVLPLDRQEIDAIVEKSITETQRIFGAMGVDVDHLRLLAQTRAVLEAMSQDVAPAPTASAVQQTPKQAIETLAALAQEVAALVASPHLDLNTLILMVLEAIYRGAGFERVIFAFVSRDQKYIEGRLGLGDDVDRLIEQFRFPMDPEAGPVSAALRSRRCVMGDQNNSIARVFGCSCVGLYPIVVGGHVVACIYMESRAPRPVPNIRELQCLGRLRDSVVTAMLQSRGGSR